MKLAEAFAIPDLDREVKWHCKYARQNGIHVSPTFMIGGLVQADMSSGDTVADWLSRLWPQPACDQTQAMGSFAARLSEAGRMNGHRIVTASRGRPRACGCRAWTPLPDCNSRDRNGILGADEHLRRETEYGHED